MRRTSAITGLAILVMLAGCAIQPPPSPPTAQTPPPAATAPPPAASAPSPPAATTQPPPTTTEPPPGSPVGTTASGGTIRVNPTPPTATATAPAVVDLVPSAEALAVLNSIPEPLPRSGAVPVPAETASTRPVVAPGIVPTEADAVPTDSVAAAPADTAGVPVPSPTEPLGDRPGSLASKALPESLAVVPPGSPPVAGSGSGTAATSGSTAGPAPAAPPGTAPTAPTTTGPIPPDSCWRVQVAAPPERERADRLADAARSQLMVAFVVEKESGLYKVRTRDCLTAAAADDLRRRAITTGFGGAFRFLRKRR